ncbi:MAG TPA: RDD family protein [Nocardioidaceae bacterium]|nr:RDD family protein [Nocardioidaceae bacterium]
MNDPRPSAEAAEAGSYPGERLGLPAQGPGAVAGWGRRILALVVDWVASTLVAIGFTGVGGWLDGTVVSESLPLVMFLLEATFLTALAGGSFGQLVCRLVIVRVDGKPVTLLQALVRTVLICLVIPPLVFNRDQRGLHDLAAGTVALRR